MCLPVRLQATYLWLTCNSTEFVQAAPGSGTHMAKLLLVHGGWVSQGRVLVRKSVLPGCLAACRMQQLCLHRHRPELGDPSMTSSLADQPAWIMSAACRFRW